MPNVPAETIQQTHLHHKKITDNHTLTANKTTTLNIGTHVYTLRPYKITIIIVIFFLPVDANVMKANVMKVYITAMHFVFVFCSYRPTSVSDSLQESVPLASEW